MCTYEPDAAQKQTNYFFLTLTVRRLFLILSGGDMEVRGYFLKKWKLCVQNLAKERKQPAVVILRKSIFYNISIQCLWLRIIRRSDQGV